MALITDADKEALKARIPEVLQFFGVTDLTRNFSSPWRDDDRDPSAKYYPDTNLVTDFGGDTVDVFGLVGKVEGISSFPDQVRRVAEIVGYGLGEGDAPLPMRKRKRPRFEPPVQAGFAEAPLLEFAELMGKMMTRESPGADAALDYLHARGFTDEDLRRNVIGYIPTKDALLNDDGSRMFTMYEPNRTRGYAVIPFPADETFCTVNYCMIRAIPGSVPPAHKEIRPTGCKSPLFREWLLTAGCSVLYVAEGLLDALALETLVERPCLGLGGVPMKGRVGSVLYYSPPELRPKKVVLALDADDEGRKAAEHIARDLDCIGIPHSVLPMPEGCKDPCDMLMKFGGEG